MVKSSLQHSREKLVSSVECSHPGILHSVKSFVLKSNNSFESRASNVFNRLSSLENDHNTWMVNNKTHESFEADDVSVDDAPNAVKTDTFKKPYLPVCKTKKQGIIPKRKNMRVWRKYSLKDIPLTSDAKNAAVAFQFLNELQKRKERNICNEIASEDDKISFRKPVKRNLVQSTIVSSKEVPASSNSVAEKLPKNIGSNIKLDHLQEEFE